MAIDHDHEWQKISSFGSGYWKCIKCDQFATGGAHDGGPYYPSDAGISGLKRRESAYCDRKKTHATVNGKGKIVALKKSEVIKQ